MFANAVRPAAGRIGGNIGPVDETDLIAKWTGDNISGSILYDELGNFNGTLFGSISQITGVDGLAIQSNSGIDNYIQLPQSLFTVIRYGGSMSAAIYATASNGAMFFNVRAASGGSRQQFNIGPTGNIVMDEYQGFKSVSIDGVVPLDTWSLITWSWGPSGRRAWVNKTEVSLSNPTASFRYASQGFAALLNHWYFIDNNISYPGSAADHIRIYARESTQEDVDSRYAEIF